MATMTDASATPVRKRPAWWLIALLLIAALGAGAAGGWYFLGSSDEAVASTEEAEPAPPAAPVFVELKPFTVNVGDDNGRVLYTGITLQTGSDEAAALLRDHMPEVRNRILMVLTSHDAASLTSAAGKQALAKEIVAAFDQPFDDGQTRADVTQALFTDFIVQ
ncbi:flagellar FliL protein [Kushneria sinocarnis]|uniref:Flagellar protein FliL n=1 Tax=Kushneria sinocarnis TaxID=595502 RepID=A0A420WXZ4_9GAMM|nr:flagellar basal body-associated protein FliL [Kushneria sinocarnis]RKR06097.1 flagellar FliL protein [Kushneria sinocarnis]